MRWGNERQDDTYQGKGERKNNQSAHTLPTNSIFENAFFDLISQTVRENELFEDTIRNTDGNSSYNPSEQPKSSAKVSKVGWDSYVSKCDQFNGKIISINDLEKTFNVTMTGVDGISRMATFSFDDIDESDKRLIALDSQVIFICGKQFIYGTEYNFSKVYLRNILKWTSAQIKKANDEAKELLELLKKKNEFSDD